MTFRFRNWPVYNDSRNFRLEVNQLMKEYFPKEERFLLIDQIRRALDSMILNIAEGANRSTDKDTNSYSYRSLLMLRSEREGFEPSRRENPDLQV